MENEETGTASYFISLGGEHLVQAWGDGGRVLWLSLGVSFFFLARAEEMIAETHTRAHDIYCLKRAGVAFLRGENQLQRRRWSTADQVEVRFRGSQGDQLRKGAIQSQARKGPPRCVRPGEVPSL